MQRFFIILAYILICTNCFAQQFPFVYYTPKDGLINSRVKSIKQGSRGFIYFITNGGLSVYDGARFVNYSQESGLANELVNDIIEIAPDSFLVATNVDKLNTLVNGKVGVFQTSDNFYPVINSFFRSSNGNCYVAADQGLFLFSNSRFIKIPVHADGGNEIGNDLDRICEWKNFLFFTKWNADDKERLIVYDTIERKVIAVETSEVVSLPAIDKQGEIWVGTKSGVRQLDTASLKKGGINFSSNFPNNSSIANLKGATAFIDNLNSKFFFNKDGAFRINSRGEYQPFTVTQGLKITNLSDVFIDREANIWIATDGNGVAKLTNSGFEIWEKLNNTSAVISAITCEADTIWAFNTTDHSIYKICGNNFSIYPLPNRLSGVNSIYIKNQKLYLVLQSSILCVKNKNDPSSYKHPENIFSDENVQLGGGVMDPYGNIIIEINRNNKQFYSFVIGNKGVLFQNQHETISDQITLDNLGRLWFISRNNQLLMYSLHPDDPAHYLQLQNDFSKKFSKLDPRSIAVDRNNNLWIGTRYNGLYFLRFNGDEPDSIIHLTRKDGLSDNFIYSLASDKKGNVWAGTQTGLDKIFEKNGHYVIGNISKSNNQYRAIHLIVVTKNNTTWALTYGVPILKISGEGAAPISEPPRLTFRQMKINDSVFRFNKNAFNYNQNNFSFSVAAPSFIDEKSIQYSYLLEGSGNNTWSEASNQSAFNFINLSPAHYTLKAKCVFPEEIYSSQIISYSFVINPPWWQTWWFRSIMVLLIIGFLIIAFQFYYRRKLEKQMAVLEKQQAIEKERTRIATDMHDDLGAGLSRIKFLSETIGIKKQKDEPIGEEIGKIRDYSHEMIGKMGEIVWALNEKNDSLSDLLSYTRSYMVEYLSQNGISCSVEAPNHFPSNFVSGEFRRNIFLTVKEALHNIVKHAQADKVTLKITTDKQLEIYIHDNGTGFDKNNIRPFSNGLLNMEKRIKEIGGKLNIDSDKGTTVYISSPITP